MLVVKRVLLALSLFAMIAMVMAPSVVAHHKSEYYFAGGGAWPLGFGPGIEHHADGTNYFAGGVLVACPLRDCTLRAEDLDGNGLSFDVCGNNGGGWTCFRGNHVVRMRGFSEVGLWPGVTTTVAKVEVHARAHDGAGYGFERSYAYLPFVNPLARWAYTFEETLGMPGPGCHRHYLDVNQDGMYAHVRWIDGMDVLSPDLYFLDADGERIGAELALSYLQTPLPDGTASVLACNKGTVAMEMFGSLLRLASPEHMEAPLLMLLIAPRNG